jgi:hypothetical protein
MIYVFYYSSSKLTTTASGEGHREETLVINFNLPYNNDITVANMLVGTAIQSTNGPSLFTDIV